MMYHLRITKLEDNPHYDREMEDYRDRFGLMGVSYDNRSPMSNDSPRKELVMNILDVVIDEVELIAIRKAILETFK